MAQGVVFGEVDWNSGDVGTNSSSGRSDFMKLKEGENVVRIMGNPIQYYSHWIDTPDGQKRKIVSPIDNPELIRKLEDAGFKRKPQWIVKVLDRSDETFKILEIGSQVYNGVKALFNNLKWGKVTGYDVSIMRGKPGSQPLYTVTPNPKETLDTSFKQKFTEFNDRVNIDKIIAPATTDAVCKLMGWKPSEFSNTSSQKASESKAAGGGSGEDFEFEF